MNSPIETLVERLNAKPSGKGWMALCPAHDDQTPSLSINAGADGRALVNCLAGCEIDNVLAALRMSVRDLFPSIADVTGSQEKNSFHGASRRQDTTPAKITGGNAANASGENPPPAFDWDGCVGAFTGDHIEQLATQRGYRVETCRLLLKQKKIGIYNGCFAFAVENHAGTVVGAHYRLRDGSWRYTRGAKAAALVIGDIATAPEIHIFESQWDAIALLDRLPVGAQIATRGARNAKVLSTLIPRFNPSAEIYVWPQNDLPGQRWLDDVRRIIPSAFRVQIPACKRVDKGWL